MNEQLKKIKAGADWSITITIPGNCPSVDRAIELAGEAIRERFKDIDSLPDETSGDLEEEIREYMSDEDNNPSDWWDWRDKRDCARHFAKWQKEQKPILEVFGFKVGDAVRLKDGDGRKHIIKSFEEVEGLHGPNFYHVEFEDNSARDSIYPGEEYPNGYYTQMEKFEEEQKPVEWSDEDEKMRQGCIDSVEYELLDNGKDDEVETDPRIAWLKSLRPSWKPSEEQMEALLNIEGDLRAFQSYDKAKIIAELYEQLKRLL